MNQVNVTWSIGVEVGALDRAIWLGIREEVLYEVRAQMTRRSQPDSW